jgi:hypothetical protein
MRRGLCRGNMSCSISLEQPAASSRLTFQHMIKTSFHCEKNAMASGMMTDMLEGVMARARSDDDDARSDSSAKSAGDASSSAGKKTPILEIPGSGPDSHPDSLSLLAPPRSQITRGNVNARVVRKSRPWAVGIKHPNHTIEYQHERQAGHTQVHTPRCPVQARHRHSPV